MSSHSIKGDREGLRVILLAELFVQAPEWGVNTERHCELCKPHTSLLSMACLSVVRARMEALLYSDLIVAPTGEQPWLRQTQLSYVAAAVQRGSLHTSRVVDD